MIRNNGGFKKYFYSLKKLTFLNQGRRKYEGA